jgi:hypothetical protein
MRSSAGSSPMASARPRAVAARNAIRGDVKGSFAEPIWIIPVLKVISNPHPRSNYPHS